MSEKQRKKKTTQSNAALTDAVDRCANNTDQSENESDVLIDQETIHPEATPALGIFDATESALSDKSQEPQPQDDAVMPLADVPVAEDPLLLNAPIPVIKGEIKKPSKKNTVWKLIGLLIIFGLSAYILIALSQEFDTADKVSFDQLCARIGYLFWIIIVALFIVMLFLQTLKFWYIEKITTGRGRMGLGLRVNLYGKFYDSITPMSTGGQPFQMYYLRKNGVPIGSALSIPTLNYVIQMYAWQLVSLLFLSINHGVIFRSAGASSATVITVMCWIGWTINIFAPLLLLSLAFFPKFAYALIRGIIKIGRRLKIVKNYDKTLARGYEMLDSYRATLAFIGKKKFHIFLIMLISALEYLVLLTIPSLLTTFIVGKEFTFQSWADMATLYLFTVYATAFLPTPGGSGFAETLSTLAFKNVATDGTLFWLMLFMRLFTYYIFIILGLITFIFDFIKGKIIKRKQRKLESAALNNADALNKNEVPPTNDNPGDTE